MAPRHNTRRSTPAFCLRVAWQHAKLDVLVGTILVGGEKMNKNDFSLLKQEIRADSSGIQKNTIGYSIRI